MLFIHTAWFISEARNCFIEKLLLTILSISQNFFIQYGHPNSHIAHFDNNIVLPLLIFETLGFMFSVFFLNFSTIWFHFILIRSYYFKLLLIISFRLITSLIPIFLLSSIKLTFSTSLLWRFIILVLSFNFRYFFLH